MPFFVIKSLHVLSIRNVWGLPFSGVQLLVEKLIEDDINILHMYMYINTGYFSMGGCVQCDRGEGRQIRRTSNVREISF